MHLVLGSSPTRKSMTLLFSFSQLSFLFMCCLFMVRVKSIFFSNFQLCWSRSNTTFSLFFSLFFTACPPGTFKSMQGTGLCLQCPPNSRSTSEASTICVCRNGYYRADGDLPDMPCTSESKNTCIPIRMLLTLNKRTLVIPVASASSPGENKQHFFTRTHLTLHNELADKPVQIRAGKIIKEDYKRRNHCSFHLDDSWPGLVRKHVRISGECQWTCLDWILPITSCHHSFPEAGGLHKVYFVVCSCSSPCY